VLGDFSGYLAADELYDGPFCVLSIVDNRSFHRLVYELLDHDPTANDIRRFFRRFRRLLDARGLTVRGITTDGSPLYPPAIGEIYPNVPHQLCEFHVLAELTKAVLKAVAAVRRDVRAAAPRLCRGRPSTAAQKEAARRKKRADRKNADLFDHRHLFVKRRLTAGKRKTLARITRGLPHLRALRAIMTEVYRLFDRRCRTETALEKLAKLRRRVRRFKPVCRTLRKLFSPNIEKALTFLDDDLLPATSNAVERGNRRHRKMQKSVYRVRTRTNLHGRIALDMLRDDPAGLRALTTATLHRARAG
jgi:transposase-like protein